MGAMIADGDLIAEEKKRPNRSKYRRLAKRPPINAEAEAESKTRGEPNRGPSQKRKTETETEIEVETQARSETATQTPTPPAAPTRGMAQGLCTGGPRVLYIERHHVQPRRRGDPRHGGSPTDCEGFAPT